MINRHSVEVKQETITPVTVDVISQQEAIERVLSFKGDTAVSALRCLGS